MLKITNKNFYKNQKWIKDGMSTNPEILKENKCFKLLRIRFKNLKI